MFEQLDLDAATLTTLIETSLQGLLAYIENPLFWLQFAIIALVFWLARWVLAPLLSQGLNWLGSKSARVPTFIRLIGAIKTLAEPFAWLLLQSIAITIAHRMNWPSQGLTVISSLLSAWLLIKLATFLIRNDSIANIVAPVAWSVAAFNIFGLLTPLFEFLDSVWTEMRNILNKLMKHAISIGEDFRKIDYFSCKQP